MDDLIYKSAALKSLGEPPHIWQESDYEIGMQVQWSSDFNAIKNVPSAKSEQIDCEYCHEDSDGYVKPIEKNAHAFVRFGMDGWELDLHAKGWNGGAKIRFCPMCGRRLTDG